MENQNKTSDLEKNEAVRKLTGESESESERQQDKISETGKMNSRGKSKPTLAPDSTQTR